MIDESAVRELLRLKDGRLYRREGQELEFKEQFNFAGLDKYVRDFAAFANNRGGYIVFGIKNAPRVHIGLSKSSLEQFEKIDPERITNALMGIFSSNITWAQATISIGAKTFGVFRISEAGSKPVIAKQDAGRDQSIKSGDIFYRYGGRTQKIRYAELENIISKRIEHNNKLWIKLMEQIGRSGPQNAAILDTERAVIEKGDSQVLVIDDELAEKIKFIKEGEFTETEGAASLRLVGDVVPISHVEVVKHVKENLVRMYPYSAMQMAAAVCDAVTGINQRDVWRVIKENDLKENRAYSVYNFRNKAQQDEWEQSGKLPSAIPSIYNEQAIDFIAKILRDEQVR